MYHLHRIRHFRSAQNGCHSLKNVYKKQRLKSFITEIIIILRTLSPRLRKTNHWILILQMLHYQNLITLCYLFLTSKLQKMKYILSNNCNVMTSELRKAIMNKSKLRNKVLKTRNNKSKRRFTGQINFWVTLLRKT